MPCRFLVVCEAEADFRIITGLAERVISERVAWMDDDQLRYCPIWFGVDEETPFLKWSRIKNVADLEGIPGRRGEFSGAYDTGNTRRVFQLFKKWQYEGRAIHGILLVRDHDGQPDRVAWLRKAREAESEIGHLVVIGVARHERECWVLVGFEPQDDREVALLARLRQELSFDPCLNPERLSAQHDLRSAKRVLDQLTQEGWDRQEVCWTQTPLTLLRERGSATGLTAFLEEVADRLVPLFNGHSA